MEALEDLIGKDCIDIILDYKEQFEKVEYNHDSIDACVFEEINKEKFEKVFDLENYNIKSELLKNKYFLNDMTIGEFKDYYIEQEYIQAVTLKFSIRGEVDDSFQTRIESIKSEYMKNIKIKYIYKLSTFEVCLFLGIYQEDELVDLYKNIAYDLIEWENQLEVIIQR